MRSALHCSGGENLASMFAHPLPLFTLCNILSKIYTVVGDKCMVEQSSVQLYQHINNVGDFDMFEKLFNYPLVYHIKIYISKLYTKHAQVEVPLSHQKSHHFGTQRPYFTIIWSASLSVLWTITILFFNQISIASLPSPTAL